MKPKSQLESELENYNTYEKRKENDEVFTPDFLIEEMLDKLDPNVWSDPNKTWLDPCAGIGNFSVFILERLMKGLESWQPEPELRRKHILENMLFHIEMNSESVEKLQKVLNPDGRYKLNVKCMDFLQYGKARATKLF